MMKKFIYFGFFSIVLLFICSTTVNATDTYTTASTINGITVNWEYELNDSNQIENLKCTNPSDLTGSIALPSTLDGYTVISIGSEAFKSATNITSVTISDSIQTINYKAFCDCSNLTNVDLGNITSISFGVFKNCPELTDITIPSTLTDGPASTGVFTGTTNLTSVTFEDGLLEIPARILYGCSGIISVEIPDTVEIIHCYAFAGTSITEIDIPNSVTTIEYYAFKDCSELIKATILDNCTDIGWFNIYEDEDYVFTNHNDDLTIYCYEGSKIAEYAIATNIKYVYLTSTSSDDNTDSTSSDDSDTSSSSTSSSSEDTSTSTSTDDTVISGALPNTGVSVTIVFIIITIILIAIIFYKKYNNYKDIK